MLVGIHCTQGLFCGFILSLLLPLLVPCIVTITCLLVMLTHMRHPCPSSSSSTRHHYVTVTVTWLTVVFVACTAPSVLYYFVYVFIMLGVLGHAHPDTPTHDFILENMCSSTLPLLSALFTQTIIVLRSKGLRTDLVGRMTGGTRMFVRNSAGLKVRLSKEREQFLS